MWRFNSLSKKYWQSDQFKQGMQEFIEWINRELQIKHLNDWYHISNKEFRQVISMSAFNKYSLEEMLKLVYPDHPWDLDKFHNRNESVSWVKNENTTSVCYFF